MGVVTDFFNIVVAYGVYEGSKYEFAFTSRGGPVVPAEDYITRLLLVFLNASKVHQVELTKRRDPSKVDPDDIELKDDSYYTEKQKRGAGIKKVVAKLAKTGQANQSKHKTAIRSTAFNEAMDNETYEKEISDLDEDKDNFELHNGAVDYYSEEDDEFIEEFDRYDSYENPVILEGWNTIK
jgi:hypothetical protein